MASKCQPEVSEVAQSKEATLVIDVTCGDCGRRLSGGSEVFIEMRPPCPEEPISPENLPWHLCPPCWINGVQPIDPKKTARLVEAAQRMAGT